LETAGNRSTSLLTLFYAAKGLDDCGVQNRFNVATKLGETNISNTYVLPKALLDDWRSFKIRCSRFYLPHGSHWESLCPAG